MKPDPKYVLEVMAQIMQAPFQIIQREVDHRWTFAIAHCPSETESDDEPPIRLAERGDVIAIDGILGLYNPDAQKITIFRKGINRVSKILDARPADLQFVVRLHEWAHTVLHVGLLHRVHVVRDTAQGNPTQPAEFLAYIL